MVEVRDSNNGQSWSSRGGFTLQAFTVHNIFPNGVLKLSRSNLQIFTIEIEIQLNDWHIL